MWSFVHNKQEKSNSTQLLYPWPEVSHKVWFKITGVTISNNLSWSKHVNNISKKVNSTMAFLRRKHQTSFPTSKEYCIQDLRKTDSRIRLNGLVSTHRHRLKWARDGTEKSSQICQEWLQTQNQCYSHASGPRLGHLATTQRPSLSVYDVPVSSPTGRHPRRTVPDTSWQQNQRP